MCTTYKSLLAVIMPRNKLVLTLALALAPTLTLTVL